MFGFEIYGQTSPTTIQGFLKKDPKLMPRLPKTIQTTEAVDAQWVNRYPVGWVTLFWTYTGENKDQGKASFPEHRQTGRSVGHRTVCRLAYVCKDVLGAGSLLVEG